jgi:hypothetical protein
VFADTSLEYELDPYYSNAGLYISLTESRIPEITEEDEIQVYRQLLERAFSLPRFMVLEVSAYPMPIAGVYIKKHYPDFYDRFDIGNNGLNLIQALTEGFEEPYAGSVFFGSVVRYVRKDEKEQDKNRGYSGYLFSFGNKHIVNNDLIDDDWYEFEWKMKGDQDFKDKILSWSLRFGIKNHSNPDITDVVYFGLRRNHFDSRSESLSFIDNSDIDYKLELSKYDFSLVQQSFFINKKWHLPFTAKTRFVFGIGLIFDRGKYTGALASADNDVRLIIRPSFKF